MGKKLTSNQILSRIVEVHGDRYDLSKLVYVNKRNKVEIICKEHGSWETFIEQLFRGQGCPKCGLVTQGIKRRMTQDNFLVKCKKIHGNRYDYSKSIYETISKKIIITCKTHGDFEQSPSSHFNGSGCPKCGFNSQIQKRKLPLENFIFRSSSIHRNKYDYSMVNYKNSQTEIDILCTIHGLFQQRPDFHLRGSGCPKCSIIKVHELQKKSTEETIKGFFKIHGNRYDYSKVNVVDSKTPVIVICKLHGEFYPNPNGHLRGTGCPKCSILEQVEKQRKTLEEFINESKKIHGNVYDYSKVDYLDSSSNITIVCIKHGEFYPTPNNHLRGSGCPTCKSSKGEVEITNFFINKKIKFIAQHKFHDLFYKGKLRCDFYLIDYNLVIEYNGEQHYFPNSFFGGEEGFNKTKMRDEIKKQYCLDKGIAYEIIKYDENIIERLNDILRNI